MNNISIRRLIISALLIFTAACAVLITTASPALAIQQKARQRKKTPAKVVQYVCPMHPEVTSQRRGRCPKCGMNLVVKRDAPEAKASSENNATVTEAETTADVSKPLRIPDIPVYDQNNRRLNFYTDLVKGKTVAINFIFTTCTTICPPLTATFRRVQQTLGERVGRDVELISISVDPTTDVPERLKDFSAKFKAGPGWTFVTGSKPEIDRLLSALGGYVPDRNDHTPMVLIGNDAAGFWTRTYGLAPASQIAGIVTDAASKSKIAGGENAAAKNNSPSDSSGNYFPNLTLLTQDNKPVRFYEDLLKGKTVLINFLFTTCKGVCPPMTANLARVQKYLGERMGRDIVMLSISVDPTNDTPAVLKKFADNFKVQPGWYFLTGEKKNVDWVLYKLGGYVEDKQQHTGVLIIGNEATGEWMKVMAMSNPEEIARAATQLASKKE
jgi:protein SCO1/2